MAEILFLHRDLARGAAGQQQDAPRPLVFGVGGELPGVFLHVLAFLARPERLVPAGVISSSFKAAGHLCRRRYTPSSESIVAGIAPPPRSLGAQVALAVVVHPVAAEADDDHVVRLGRTQHQFQLPLDVRLHRPEAGLRGLVVQQHDLFSGKPTRISRSRKARMSAPA